MKKFVFLVAAAANRRFRRIAAPQLKAKPGGPESAMIGRWRKLEARIP